MYKLHYTEFDALLAKYQALNAPHNRAYTDGVIGYDEYMAGAQARLIAFSAESALIAQRREAHHA